ncbi:MAG: sulfur carrier protein ThiS [Staphylococcus sp.]|nr:sulfur carrier protein ThiS [Staphylococcus sp.]
MEVTINGLTLQLPTGSTLSDALDARCIPSTGIATAVNGKVVPAVNRSSCLLAEGDNVVIIKAFYGG